MVSGRQTEDLRQIKNKSRHRHNIEPRPADQTDLALGSGRLAGPGPSPSCVWEQKVATLTACACQPYEC
jgi:hypothetical protein